MHPPPEDSDAGDTSIDGEGGRYCLDCFYPLEGLARAGRCPECGRAFNLDNLYSYSVEPRPPLCRHLTGSHRVAALLLAVGLSSITFFETEWLCAVLLLFPLWEFVLILSWFIALRLDHIADRASICITAGAIIGFATLLPVNWYPALFIGLICGAFCGLHIFYLKITGWLD